MDRLNIRYSSTLCFQMLQNLPDFNASMIGSHADGFQATSDSHKVINVQVNLIRLHLVIYDIITTSLLYYCCNMSFLQILSTDKSSNPALRQLYRGHKPKMRLPPSPHPYVNYHEHQLSFSMRETHLQLNGLHLPPHYPPLKQKATSNASRSKYFLMKTSKTQEQIVTSKQKVIPKHYSFSSYLATKGQSGKKNRTKQLRFFDLDEITQQMAHPKRMSSKLSTEEQQKACHINLSSCKQELKNVNSDKDRYRHTQPSKRNLSNSWLQNDFGKMKRKSLGGFQRNKRYSGGEQIIPWEQNQEQNQFDFREANAQLLEFLPTS